MVHLDHYFRHVIFDVNFFGFFVLVYFYNAKINVLL